MMHIQSTPAYLGQRSDDSFSMSKEGSARGGGAAAPDPSSTTQDSPGDGRYKSRLLISVGVLLVTACASPLLLYFLLKDVAHTRLTVAIAVPSAIFGASSLFAFGQRCWSLGRAHSTTRPIGGGRWGFDFFHWNFTVGFLCISGFISGATSTQPPLVRVAALPLTLLIAQVCVQLLLVQFLTLTNLTYICRVSSMAKGTGPVRPALYTIIEDVVAVDGQQGTSWRQEFDERYERDGALRALLRNLSWVWGFSGLAVAALNFALILALHNEDVAWVIGWTVPWVWTALMALMTLLYIKKRAR